MPAVAIEIGACPSSSGRSDRSDTKADFLLLENEKQQKQTMKHPQTDIKVVSERVISKTPRDLPFTDLF